MVMELWHELLGTSALSHVCILALTVFVAVYYLMHTFRKHQDFSNIPPGPKPWPIVGNFGGFLVPNFIWKRFGGWGGKDVPKSKTRALISPQVIITEQAKVYGNIYSMWVGSQLVVVLNGYEVVRDALSNRADVFSDRPEIPTVTIMTKRKGIVFAPYGPVWRRQRKFCHTTLRNFGLGKLSLEPCILEGLAVVKSELLRLGEEDTEGSGVDLTPLITNSVSNVISYIALGQRFHHADREFGALLDLMARGLEIIANSAAVLINVFPLLYYLPFGVFREVRQVERDITAFLKQIITRHRETLDPANPRDLIDMYLVEMLAQEAAGETDSSFSEDYLFYIIGDLFIAGTDTTTNTVLWMMLYMVVYPDIQERVQAEIDAVVGPDRVPSLTDKGSLPFTEATIMEVQRMTVVVPLAIPHMASETTVSSTRPTLQQGLGCCSRNRKVQPFRYGSSVVVLQSSVAIQSLRAQ
ncbi:cytochrome P450 2U1 isoform X2 [Salvelinus alpinus]|uniref:cytochrome P450 2U1 isoform X2 n=1 Tax=Salvelinus alpinus TaxID=8036 RepID=UPI0039FD7BCA